MDASAEIIANNIENMVNCMGNDDNLNVIMNHMLNCHRTLNQKFTGQFVVNFIRNMSIKYTNGDYDMRNESACKVCNIMWECLKDNFNLINDNERFSLNFI